MLCYILVILNGFMHFVTVFVGILFYYYYMFYTSAFSFFFSNGNVFEKKNVRFFPPFQYTRSQFEQHFKDACFSAFCRSAIKTNRDREYAKSTQHSSMCLCGIVIALLTAGIVIKTYVFSLRLHIYTLPSHDKRCRWQRPIGDFERK